MNCCTYASCNIHLLLSDIIPKTVTGIKKLLVIGFGGKVSHSSVKVHRSYSMACGLSLPADGSCTLLIGIVLGIVAPDSPVTQSLLLFVELGVNAPYIYKVLCKLQTVLITAHTVKLHKSELYLGVSRVAFLSVTDKSVVDVLCIFQAHIKKLPLTCCLIVCRTSLKQMP